MVHTYAKEATMSAPNSAALILNQWSTLRQAIESVEGMSPSLENSYQSSNQLLKSAWSLLPTTAEQRSSTTGFPNVNKISVGPCSTSEDNGLVYRSELKLTFITSYFKPEPPRAPQRWMISYRACLLVVNQELKVHDEDAMYP
ncbi:hypothetical protein F5H01DRAFT_322470 [Linnemannia elongata]|nr:hypothetical protein F5H01DRAFT_322470 [Linnemannia elongata]